MKSNIRNWSLAFLIPGLAIYLIVVIVPTVQVVNSGFYQWSPGQVGEWVGLGNYFRMFQDPAFIRAMSHTVALLFGSLILQLPMGFFLALLIHRKMRGHNFFLTVFFIPVILASVVVGVLWTLIYQSDYGLLNTALKAIGLGDLARPWLGNTDTALWSVIVAIGWNSVGLYVLIFLAALQRIPQNIYEASELDGADGWMQTRRITIPLMFDSVKLAVILVVTGSVQYLNLIWAMTKGGPADSSSVLASYMFTSAFTNSQLGYGAAIGTVMLVLNLILAVGLQRAFRREPIELG